MTMWCMCAAARVRSAAPARRSQLPMLAGASLARRLRGRSPREAPRTRLRPRLASRPPATPHKYRRRPNALQADRGQVPRNRGGGGGSREGRAPRWRRLRVVEPKRASLAVGRALRLRMDERKQLYAAERMAEPDAERGKWREKEERGTPWLVRGIHGGRSCARSLGRVARDGGERSRLPSWPDAVSQTSLLAGATKEAQCEGAIRAMPSARRRALARTAATRFGRGPDRSAPSASPSSDVRSS